MFKNIFLGFLILGTSTLAQAGGMCGNTDKNGFIMGFTGPNKISISFSGTNPDTVASEILAYMKKAGPAGGVTQKDSTLFGNVADTTYKAGNIGVSVASDVCPPLDVGVNRDTGLWPQWDAALVTINNKSVIKVIPSPDDALTLATLMKAAGVATKPDGNFKDGVIYTGSNITCDSYTIDSQAAANCQIIVDPAN